jgi:hypothetical protein
MLMKLIDRIHMVQPYRRSRRIVDAQEEAMHRYVKPEIFNPDQGNQYESPQVLPETRLFESCCPLFTYKVFDNWSPITQFTLLLYSNSRQLSG